ncbi:MAG: ketoacyl-ACP synthase III [Clostridiales bacterium]|nr:beta-ketoacyl-ACP synthase III [Bacillota bacterium]NLK03004.1 ketoacyl-ACP synthase III [Clostridiales bacterium]
MSHVIIKGTGSYLPENVMSNDDLSKMVDTSDDWIRTRTGISERRISTGERTSDLAYEAGLRALKSANLKPDEIDLIICATITADSFMPSCACKVQGRLGASLAAAFDLTAACTGMIYGMVTAEQFIKTGMYSNVLVIGAETLSGALDWEDRSTCVLFGDGASAVVLSRSDSGGGIIGSNLEADGSKKNLLTLPATTMLNPYVDKDIEDKQYKISMQGQEVFKFAVRTITSNIDFLLNKTGLTKEDIDYIIPHQANLRIIEQAAKFCKVPVDKFFMNLDRYGNTSAASIGIALDELVASGNLNPGNKIILVGFGGGMTGGSILIEWV